MRQGRKINAGSALILGMVFAWAHGCGTAETDGPEYSAPTRSAGPTSFDAKNTGSITGTVTWTGEVPRVAPFRVRYNQTPGSPPRTKQVFDNPNAPVVDRDSGGVRGAVVFLHGVDPRKAKLWDLPRVTVEQWGQQFHVLQGMDVGRVGFVRCGDPVTMVSRDNLFHSLHVGGTAFFTLAFPDPDRPIARRLNEKGLVELTSAAGYYWMRAYLFVAEHAYYTRTDPKGRFTLDQVPPGR